LLLAATALALAVLASFAPVTAFFTFSTKSHPFMQILNAALFTVAGLVGLRFVARRLAEALSAEMPETDPEARPRGVSFASAPEPHIGRVIAAWFVIYGLVAAQMGWLLRPFIGSPHLPQELFRQTENNIFHGLLEALRYLD
jgi:hypothetical protein